MYTDRQSEFTAEAFLNLCIKTVTGVTDMGERLTKRDIEKIEEEIEHRKLVIRKEAIEAVKEARAQGDLSENFEYYAAKKHKNQNESRIRYLESLHLLHQITINYLYL